MAEFLNLLPPEEARHRWLQALEHHTAAERIATAQALHRITAEAVLSPHPVPPFNRAEVDGYAYARATPTLRAKGCRFTCM